MHALGSAEDEVNAKKQTLNQIAGVFTSESTSQSMQEVDYSTGTFMCETLVEAANQAQIKTPKSSKHFRRPICNRQI